MSSDIRMSRCGLNTINRKIIPVIFVPGIMGSRLKFTSGPSKGEFWDPDDKVRMAHWYLRRYEKQQQSLHFMNDAEVVKELSSAGQKILDKLSDIQTDVKNSWAGVAWGFYGSFLFNLHFYYQRNDFVPHCCPVYAFGYDWRQNNKTNGLLLSKYVLDLLKKYKCNKCILITHSMGGILTRSALHQSNELQNATVGILHVFQPACGSPNFYRQFFTGATGDSGALNWILGNTGKKFATISSGIPAAFQLLPTNKYRDLCKQEGVNWLSYQSKSNLTCNADDDVYAIYKKKHSDTPPGLIRTDISVTAQQGISSSLEIARLFNEDFKGYFLKEKTWSIYGTGLTTDSTCHFNLNNNEDRGYDPYPKIQDGNNIDDERDKVHVPITTYIKAEQSVEYSPDKPLGQSKFGDGTVPEISGYSLFPELKNRDIGIDSDLHFENQRQFMINGVEHSKIFNDEQFQNFSIKWIKHIINLV